MADSNLGLRGKLKSFEINLVNYTQDHTIDIRSLVADMTIYENMFGPTLHGVMTLFDGVGLISGYEFPLIGEEFLTISYEVPFLSIPKKTLTFFVYKIDHVMNGVNLKHKRYILHFASIEHLIDSTVQLQKAYKQPYSDIVQNILKEQLKTVKPVEVQATKGIQSFIVPRRNPLDAINMIRKRSIAATESSAASYVFFETTEGFKFCDIEYLIKKGREKIKSNKDRYTYFISQGDLQRVATDTGQDNHGDPHNYNLAEFKTLFDFTQEKKTDTIQKIKMGMYQSKTLTFDPVKLTLTSNAFHYNPDKGTMMGKFPTNSAAWDTDLADHQQNQAREFYVFKDSTQPDTFLDEVEPTAASYMTNLAQNLFTARTIGDPSILVGDLINVPFVPAYRDPDGKGNDDKLLSGEFLIVGIVHKFGLFSYAMDLELYKNGYAKKVEDVVNLNNQQ